jgi:hypothetical protein
MDVHFLGWSASSHVWFYTSISEKIRDQVDTETSILATKENLARESGNIRADMIKWMFVFWVGQALTTFGLIVLFLKK